MAPHINGSLYLEQVGKSGRPMVFIHPLPYDRSCWTYQMAHFSSWFRTIAVDLPGYGNSPTVSPGVAMSDYAQACWEAVEEIADEPAILVGLSAGSTIAKYMANQHPDRCVALVLTGGPFYARPDAPDIPIEKPFQYFMDAFVNGGIGSRRALLEQFFSADFRESSLGRYFVDLFVERNVSADAPSIIEMMRALIPADPQWLHPGGRCPVLIVMGGSEPPRTQEGHFALHRHLPTSEMRVIQGAGHCCNMEKPWEYDGYVMDFLVRHSLLTR
jgi:pimeloyl-ACP methyl ester carboxylesterase